MEIVKVNKNNIELFSKVLIDSVEWLNTIEKSMWKIEDLEVNELLKKYAIDDMKLCYENGNFIGVCVLQWYDSVFWGELKKGESGILHKLAVRGEYRKKGYGKKIIESVELLCKNQGVNELRLNCGSLRPKLRNFYESVGFKMVDRVFIDNRDQIRYQKVITNE